MSTPVLICDDSSFAQKQMAKALPDDWDIVISYAKNGVEGISALMEGKGDILFLDLNMPEMDGYEVLELIQKQELSTTVIVVSGDIQPEAHRRVMELGALDFIKKPIDKAALLNILDSHNLRVSSETTRTDDEIEVNLTESYQEVANVAMGRAADLLARLLNCFVIMPIPNVSAIEVGELQMALDAIGQGESVSAVCQGFIGSGIAGEALLIFHQSSFTDMAELMKFEGEIDNAVELELVMDTASILVGACLKGIAEQLDVSFSQSNPIVLGQHIKTSDLIKRGESRWKKTLAIEMTITIENRNINCDLLLLFTEESIPRFDELLQYVA